MGTKHLPSVRTLCYQRGRSSLITHSSEAKFALCVAPPVDRDIFLPHLHPHLSKVLFKLSLGHNNTTVTREENTLQNFHPPPNSTHFHGLHPSMRTNIILRSHFHHQLTSATPCIGQTIAGWVCGGFSLDNPTVTRFFASHFLLPVVMAGIAIIHPTFLGESGSNSALGIVPSPPLLQKRTFSP